jgi:hypothetical protein
LKNGYIDIYQDYDRFLELVARWIREQAASSPRGGLVCQAMREANHVWFGIGVYTICEILFMAGQLHLSSFLLSLSIDHQITRHLSFLEGDRGF